MSIYIFGFQQWCLSIVGMAAAIGQSNDVPIIIRLLASHLFFCPEGSSITSDRQYYLVIDAGTSADDPSAVADSYIRDWWNAESCPASDQNLQFGFLKQALDHHSHATGKNLPFPPKLTKDKYTRSRDLSGITLQCNNCRLYRGVALGLAHNLNDMRNRIHGIEVKYELHGDMSERRAAGFFQLYDGVLMKELNKDATNMVKGKSKESRHDKSLRVQKLAADELARLETLSSLKWTWGVELSADEAINIAKHNSVTKFRQHSGYNESLPWGRRGEDSSEPGSFASSQVVSEINNDNLDIPELNTIDIPLHFTTGPLRQELDEVPPEQLPRLDIPDISSSDGGNLATAAATDVFSDLDSDNGSVSDTDTTHLNPADVFTSVSNPDIRIGIHALCIDPDSSSIEIHPADQVFSSSDSLSENPSAGANMSSDPNSDVLATNAFSDLDADIIPTHCSETGLTADTVSSHSDNVAAGDIYSSESDDEDEESNSGAAHVFSSSECDSDDLEAADVYHFTSDDESGVDGVSAVLGEQLIDPGLMEGSSQMVSTPEARSMPTIPGPFNAQFFSSFPSKWMDAIDGEDISDADGDDIVSEE